MPFSESYIPYGRQTITEEDIAEVVNVLRSPNLTQGPLVPAFEQAVANKVEAIHGVAVNSATSALHIACLALGLGPGDRLWTSPVTFVASANCARYCGAMVDFVDVAPSTGLMCVRALRSKLKHAEVNGTLPKVVVPVHLAGSSCDMSAIGDLADRYGFSVLEDASHAIGGNYMNHPVGSCSYSSISVFSFHPVKIITTGEGGIATTNDSLLALRMEELRSHGIVRDINRFQFPAAGPWTYEQQCLGFNYRMTDIQAALGLSQLQRLNQIVAERNRLLKSYQELVNNLPVAMLAIPPNVLSSVHLAVMRLQDCSAKRHKQVFEGFRASGVGVQIHYIPVHLQPYYQNLGFHEGQFPEAEFYSRSAISLPLYPGLSCNEQKRVINILSNLLR